jgi:Tfp pilus assembly protein PilO
MSRIQQWVAGTVAVVIAIVAAGWFLAIAPQRHRVTSLASQAAAQEQGNSKLRTNLAVLTSQMQDVTSEQADIAATAQRIPANPDMPDYVRALTAAAQQAGVELVSISPSTPAAVALPAVAVPVARASDEASAASSTAPAQSGGTAAPAAPVVPPVSLQTISLSLSVQGGYVQIQQFTAALEKMSRSTVVSSIALAPGTPLKAPALATGAVTSTTTAWKSLQATIVLNVFMNSSATFTVPTAPAQAPGAAIPSAATASPSPSASASN